MGGEGPGHAPRGPEPPICVASNTLLEYTKHTNCHDENLKSLAAPLEPHLAQSGSPPQPPPKTAGEPGPGEADDPPPSSPLPEQNPQPSIPDGESSKPILAPLVDAPQAHAPAYISARSTAEAIPDPLTNGCAAGRRRDRSPSVQERVREVSETAEPALPARTCMEGVQPDPGREDQPSGSNWQADPPEAYPGSVPRLVRMKSLNALNGGLVSHSPSPTCFDGGGCALVYTRKEGGGGGAQLQQQNWGVRFCRILFAGSIWI
jgi:hypothetical protein